MTWQDDAQGMQWKQSDDKDAMPRIRWAHGRKVGKVVEHGRWYAKADAMQSAPSGWQDSQLYDDGGFEAVTMSFVPLLKRSQAYSVDTDGSMEWQPHWKKGLKLYTEVVCLIANHDEPVIFACKGFTAARVIGTKNSVVSEHLEYVHKEANKTAKAQLPPWAFWIPCGGAYDKYGNAVFVEVGAGSAKTALHDIVLQGISKACTREQLTNLYVGKHLLDYGLHVRNGLIEDGWHNKKRGNVETEQEMPNTPKPIDSDDLAF